jgi:5-methylcytosine-specific restriction endonuclease McrA
MNVQKLDDQELQLALKTIAQSLRESTADGITLLVEIGRRDLHVSEGYASLFTYCLGELCFTKGMASRWSRAAKVAAQYPDVIERLRDGRLSLCVLTVLADRPELVAEADHMTKEEAERLLVTAKPRPEKKDVVPAIAFPTETTLPVVTFECAGTRLAPVTTPLQSPVIAPAAAPRQPAELITAQKRSVIEPITSTKSRLHFDVEADTLAKLHRAREVMRGKDLGAIVGAALDLLLDAHDPLRRHERRERARAARKAPPKTAWGVALKVEPSAAPRTEPAAEATPERRPRRPHLKRAVKDAAQAAAGGQCEFVGRSGRRCTEREWSEHDHVQPLAFGGANDLENIRILCKRHHRQLTSQSFHGWSPFPAAR